MQVVVLDVLAGQAEEDEEVPAMKFEWWCPWCWMAKWKERKDRRRGRDLYEALLNPTGATCPCAKSIAVYCRECEGNKR